MKKNLKICFILIAFFGASAQAADFVLSEKIAVVDIQDVTAKSEVGKNAASVLQKKANEYQSYADNLQKEIQKMDKELMNQKSILSEKAFDEKMQKRNERFVEVNKIVQDKRYSFDKAKYDIDNEIMEHVFHVIEEISKERNFELVLPSNGNVLFFHKNLNISNEVLKRLDKRVKKLKITF